LPEIRSASQLEDESAETIGAGGNAGVADVFGELQRDARFSFKWKQWLVKPQLP